jgi:hypothetical protein
MAVELREVFISSNFEEFSQLRGELKERIDRAGFARAIDLDRNVPDPRSPLQLSLNKVRSADLLVLLVGERYGDGRPDGQHSFTHLEYREAQAEGIPILAYFIGLSFRTSPRLALLWSGKSLRCATRY